MTRRGMLLVSPPGFNPVDASATTRDRVWQDGVLVSRTNRLCQPLTPSRNSLSIGCEGHCPVRVVSGEPLKLDLHVPMRSP